MDQLHVTGKQKIGNFEFIGIEGGFGEGKKAMTVKDIAEIHGREVKAINQAINMNRSRFKNGIDIMDLKEESGSIRLTEFFSKQQIANYNNIYILSERGYFKLLKILEDDTAWDIYDQLIDNYFNYRKTVQSIGSDMSDLDVRRVNATARLENALVRKAKLLSELSENATTEVNKAILQDKAAEILTGEKILEMPTLRQHLYDSDQIAKKVGVYSKNGKPHGTAVSQLIKREIFIEEGESEIVPEATNHWGGSVTKYAESVIDKVEAWLEANGFPSRIKGSKKDYHVQYEF
ncbi:ORF6N domain-containing protein [Enterococcus hulanensis]|uniref:ORF6N domain-containing protein n=1 Tax=Enterococcus hulanensis TaxID=2559929 RepID=UPI00288F6848|nr:ORF6N domain-containing protein [Enterococcus hulanensis]MDT2662909.1 ORF6N domain-containing protein [Enterococcus hulanensis]